MEARVLNLLFRVRMQSLRNLVTRLHQESFFKIVVVGGLGAGFWVALYLIFNESFYFLNSNAYVFRDLLCKRILSLFFLTLLIMLVFSNALISFSNLFRSKETEFLFSHPVRHDTIFIYKLLESLLFSSWAFLAMGVPLLIAYGVQERVEPLYYVAMVLYLIPFIVIPAGIGALLGLLITAFVPRHRGKALAALGIAVAIPCVWFVVDVLNARAGHEPMGLGTEMRADVQMILGKLDFTQYSMTPNFWMTQGLFLLGRGGPQSLSAGLAFFAALVTTALVVVVTGWFIAGTLYESTYSFASVATRGRQRQGRWWFERLITPIQRRWPGVTVIVIKDVKTFLRDPVQWAQVLIFFGLLTVYIANLRNFSYPLDRIFYQNLISFLNLGATCLTLATMISRFVFPLMSLEGRRFWVLGLVPLARRRILMAKFIFSLSGALLVTESLVLLSNYVLRSAPIIYYLQAVTAALICLGLTGLAVGMGAIFPSLHEQNPSKIVSGFGGTLTLILSVFMVMFIISVEALVCHRFLVQDMALDETSEAAKVFHFWMWIVVGGAVLVTVLAAYIPMRLGARALDRMEF